MPVIALGSSLSPSMTPEANCVTAMVMSILAPLGMTQGSCVQEQEQRERWARGQVEAEKQKRSSAALLAAQGPAALLFVRSPLTQTEVAAADGWLAILRCAAW